MLMMTQPVFFLKILILVSLNLHKDEQVLQVYDYLILPSALEKVFFYIFEQFLPEKYPFV